MKRKSFYLFLLIVVAVCFVFMPGCKPKKN